MCEGWSSKNIIEMYIFLVGIFILFVIWAFIVMIVQSNKHKAFIKEKKPCRFLTKAELEAIQYFDIDKPILNFFRPRLPKSKADKAIYCFSNCSFSIQERSNSRTPTTYFFYITVDNELIEVLVPKYFVEYITTHYSKTYNISCVNRHSTFVLVEIEGMMSYPELHNKFRLNDSFVHDTFSKRMATKEEEKLFLFSKWASAWFSVSLITLPLLFLMFFEEPDFFLFMTPLWLPLVVFSYLSYKKRKKYLQKSLVIHRLKGILIYDKERDRYYIDDVKLKLPFRWYKQIKENFIVSEEIEIEAFLHTYDSLDEEMTKSLQPISIQSNRMRIDHKKVPIARSIWMPLLAFIFAISMVFGMHFDKFVPYTYYAINTSSAKSDFYSSDTFMQEKIQEKQYVETLGLALPILHRKYSSLLGYDIVEIDENYIFFPIEIAESIIGYPKVPKEFTTVIQLYRKMKFNIEFLKGCKDYQNDKSYMNYCTRTTLDKLREHETVFEPFETYGLFFKETTPQSFDAFKKELFSHYKSELYAFYNKLELLLKEGTTYRRYPQNSNYGPKGFYENMEYLDYIFSYLDTFPKTETLAGIVSDVHKKVWHVEEDNYNYLFYTLFLTLFWFLSIISMFYLFWVLIIRLKTFKDIFTL